VYSFIQLPVLPQANAKQNDNMHKRTAMFRKTSTVAFQQYVYMLAYRTTHVC